MNERLKAFVRQRADGRCEYCQLPQKFSLIPFEIDHVIARKHRGPTVADNLALSCFYCNSYKGANLSGIDPETGAVARLFDPRRQKWVRHFRWNGPYLEGRTRIGRATITVLEINHQDAVDARRCLIEEEGFPPQ